MESRQFLFDPPARHGNMLYLGNGDSGFQDTDFADALKAGEGVRMMMSMEDSSRRRPFFSSQDDMFDEEYYDEQMPDKKRRLTQEQVVLLEKSFEAENKLEPDRKTQLAGKLGLQPRQVAVWFQNRRARGKTKQVEREYDVLKSTYDSLLSNYDSVVKENEKLKSEVVSLSEKLEAKEVVGISNPPKKSVTSTLDITPISSNFGIKLEDGWSTGTGGSTVVDEDGPQLLDSGNSYFLSNDYTVIDSMHSEEDDRSDDGRSCFHDVFAQNHVEVESLGWWDWS